MADLIRDALQRLIEAVVSGTIPDIRDAINHARAALSEPADGPAVPEGRGPASVAEQPRPAPPAEGEVAELVAWLRENAEDERQMSEATTRASLMLDRAAKLLERHVAPVPAETLAARPLIEQVAAMGDCIGQQTVGQIMSLASRAASWLAENPPGQPVAIEPRGCPMPGACSCLEPAPQGGEAQP